MDGSLTEELESILCFALRGCVLRFDFERLGNQNSNSNSNSSSEIKEIIAHLRTRNMEEMLVQRLGSAVARLEALSSSSPSSGSRSFNSFETGNEDAASDPSIAAFDDLIAQCVTRVSLAAEKIGGQVLQVTKIVQQAFSVQKQLLITIKQCKKNIGCLYFNQCLGKHSRLNLVQALQTGVAQLKCRSFLSLTLRVCPEFLKPLNEVIMKSHSLTEGKRSNFFNHLKSASDSLGALAWVAYTGKECGISFPISHVEESWQTAEFYNNKILVEYKSKDPNHVEWAKALKELYLPGLRDFVKSFYPLGPVWCPTGKSVSAPISAPSKPGGPAPPPPPSGYLMSAESSHTSSSKPGMAALFQEISSGSVTSGLRKVTDDMKTKNRKDRPNVVSVSEKVAHASSSSSKVRPPKLELQMGLKWMVENQFGMKDLVISDCDAKQSVYIFGCKDSVLQIQGKVNNITIDKCSNIGVLFMDVVAACEVVNCNGVEVQCQGSAPTISVDNTSGCQLYLSKDSLDTSITTAKSSEINVLVPDSNSDGDWGEHSLPQQYLHIFKDGQFVTSTVSHSGA